MLKLMGKKIFRILSSNILFVFTNVCKNAHNSIGNINNDSPVRNISDTGMFICLCLCLTSHEQLRSYGDGATA